VRDIGGHNQYLSGRRLDVFTVDGKNSLSIDYLHRRMIRCGVLTEPLAPVKRKQGDGSDVFIDNGFADNRIGGIVNQGV
jgi:hypothetical protein